MKVYPIRFSAPSVYTQTMPLSIPAVQAALKEEGLDGWLLYDFHGSNPVARRIADIGSGIKTTRRWYYMIPASGEPRKLVHAIESFNLDHLEGGKTVYSQRDTLASGLKSVLTGAKRIAMEYSPGNSIPYISRVDGGTLEAVRQLGVDVVSSGDLVQRFEAIWSAEALASHRAAAERLYRIKDRAFDFIRAARRAGRAVTELDAQREMVRAFEQEGLLFDSPPVVAAQENAGDPHYGPSEQKYRAINDGEVVLLDLWGKLPTEGAVYADITWMGFTGSSVPDTFLKAFTAARDGR